MFWIFQHFIWKKNFKHIYKQRYHNEHPWTCGSALTMINILPVLFPLLLCFVLFCFLLNLMTFQFSGGIQRSCLSSSLLGSFPSICYCGSAFPSLCCLWVSFFSYDCSLFSVFKCQCFFFSPFLERSIYFERERVLGRRAEGESLRQTPHWGQSLTQDSRSLPWNHDLRSQPKQKLGVSCWTNWAPQESPECHCSWGLCPSPIFPPGSLLEMSRCGLIWEPAPSLDHTLCLWSPFTWMSVCTSHWTCPAETKLTAFSLNLLFLHLFSWVSSQFRSSPVSSHMTRYVLPLWPRSDYSISEWSLPFFSCFLLHLPSSGLHHLSVGILWCSLWLVFSLSFLSSALASFP